MGVRQGGFQGDVPIAFHPRSSFQIRLKIVIVFDPVFLRFWVHLGSQDDHQNLKKSFEIRARNCITFWIDSRIKFYRFFLRFSTPCEGKNQAKTIECCSFLHFSHFRLVFPSGLDFGPSWAPFWSGFGLLFLTFFTSKGDQKINDFSHHFFYEFGSILAPKMAPGCSTIAGKSPPRGVQGHLEDVAVIFCLSWLRFGTLLGRFLHHFNRFWHLFSTDVGVDVWFFGPFSLTSGIAPFSFHAFVLPFLPPAMHLFVPPSFHRCFPLSLVPFRIWVLAFLWHVRRSPFPQRPSTVLHFFVHLFLHRLAPTIRARRPARSD